MTSSSAASPTPPKQARRPVWAGRNYTLLAGSAFITALGANGALIASAFAVLEAGGSGGDVGLVAAARTLFLVIFLLVGGAVADRLPRHHVMVAANALSFLSQGAFALLVLTGEPQLWQMMALSALGGMGQAFFSPAAEGMLMSSVTAEQASRAFALFRMAMSGAAVGGAALGGALVAAFGPGWVLAVDAAAFAVAGALRCFLDVSHIAPRAPGGGLLSDMREGWREVVSRPWLWGIIAQFSVVVAVVGAAEAVFGPLVARNELGGAGPWGFALGAFGAGTILGGLLMMRWKPKRLLFAATLSVFSLALPSAALAVPVPLSALVAVMFVSGIMMEVFGVSWITALHQEIPEEKLSRVSAYDWFGSVAMVPLATALAGPAESAFGLAPSLWGCSAMVVVATAAVLFVPDVRNLRRRESTEIAGAVAATGPDDAAAVGVTGAVTAAVTATEPVTAPSRDTP
ncbi:MFS transporter [Streptomyces sp. NPDC059639]|uniref:MFS transporter n=1 Tax=Streptomyces sp. NPDC059639 TaxID=3346891 RepID=UPI00369C1ED0